MAVHVEFSKISNDQSKLAVFVNDRPLYWDAHTLDVPVKLEDGSEGIRKDIKATSLFWLLVNRYTDMTNVKDQKEVKEAQKKLKSALGIETYNQAMQVVFMTQNIASQMASQSIE